ncbi:MAG: manganese efflux pump [Lachnospiraceae bacterium]|nr:manganese efflux pump [Lachnospiraceae bacterium]
MGYVVLILTAVGLAMDSFAMSAQKSLIREQRGKRIAMACAFWFGLCQASMVLCGLLFGKLVSLIHSYDSYVWVPCAALGIAGIYMIVESMTTRVPPENDGIDAMSMLGPAIATSCDALLVGLLFVNESAGIVITGLLMIGLVTALISIFGVWVGRRKGTRYNGIVQVIGGVVLILLGIEKLLENLDVLKFTL